MKKSILIGLALLFFKANAVWAQDIPKTQVPSVIINSFQQAFPKATDIEWELYGDLYKAEFETGLFGTDHEVWYNKNGKLAKHKEEISKSDLPKKITAKISKDFSGYSIDDVKKITKGSNVVYTLELNSFTKEWKMAFDKEGNVLSKIAD